MAAVNLQSVEHVLGLQLDSVQLKQFKHNSKTKTARICDKNCHETDRALEEVVKKKSLYVIMKKIQMWYMFVTMVITYSLCFMEKDLAIDK